MCNMNRLSNACKIGLKGYDFFGDLLHLGLFFMQNLCKTVSLFELLRTYTARTLLKKMLLKVYLQIVE